jgi:hypothetical protein
MIAIGALRRAINEFDRQCRPEQLHASSSVRCRLPLLMHARAPSVTRRPTERAQRLLSNPSKELASRRAGEGARSVNVAPRSATGKILTDALGQSSSAASTNADIAGSICASASFSARR